APLPRSMAKWRAFSTFFSLRRLSFLLSEKPSIRRRGAPKRAVGVVVPLFNSAAVRAAFHMKEMSIEKL
ncbi:MAG: hypothetical protein ACREU7_05975, partial [Burkholderiales bacterium]